MAIRRTQNGQALVMVLVMMLILQVVAVAFLSRVNVEQRLAGGSARSLAAFYLAEAGVQRALRMLEEGTDVPLPHQETLGSGAFTIEALEPSPGGLTSIAVRGEVAGAVRRLKVLSRVGPQALGYGIFGRGIVAFGGQARTYVVTHRVRGGLIRRLGDLAAGVEARFDSPRAALNAFSGLRLRLRDGDIADSALLGDLAGTEHPPGLTDLALLGKAQLVSGMSRRPVDLEELRRQVGGLGVRRLRTRPTLPAPTIDLDSYKTLAEANTANAAINSAAGGMAADAELRGKKHSRYSVEEFEAILDYFRNRPTRTLQGMIFVDGEVLLEDGDKLTIADGALVVEGDIDIAEGARLEVRHGQAARTLPGVIAGSEGTIEIEDDAVVIVDGLILAEWDVRVHAAVLDVIGAIAARNFLVQDGTVVVRYDSGVLATMGLRKTKKGIAEPVSWQELP